MHRLRPYLPAILVGVIMTASVVDAQTLTVTRAQLNQLTGNVNTLQTKVEQLSSKVTALEKQVETQRSQVNTTLAYLREDKCRYEAAILLLSTRPSQLSTDPLTKGCPDQTKPARAIPADVPKG